MNIAVFVDGANVYYMERTCWAGASTSASCWTGSVKSGTVTDAIYYTDK